MTMLFCLDIYLGLPKFLYMSMTETVVDTVHYAFVTMPILVLYAKIIPEKIESAMFALTMGIINLCNYFIAPNWGNLINLWFVHADSENLDNTWKLYIFQSVLTLIPLFFIKLVPTRQ